MTAFRFGVTTGGPTDLATWVESARRVEGHGYATLLVPDTLNTLAPLPALAAAAAVTTTLRVGTWVLCDPLRNPRQVAWEAASLDRLTGGRFELGLGAGRPGAEQDAERLGVRWGSARERVDRLVDSVTAIRDLLDGALPGVAPSTHRVPLLIAASGPRLLAYAGRAADIVALGWPPATTEDEAERIIGRVRDGAGGRPVELASGLVAVGEERHPWLQRLGVDAAQLAAAGAVTVVTGTARAMADTLERRRDRLGLSYVTVPVQSADAFAPVVELLTGT